MRWPNPNRARAAQLTRRLLPEAMPSLLVYVMTGIPEATVALALHVSQASTRALPSKCVQVRSLKMHRLHDICDKDPDVAT